MSRNPDAPVTGQGRAIDAHSERARRLESLGQLTVAFTHDLNNLLGTIANCSALVGRHTTDRDDLDELAHIRGAVEQAATMSRKLATLARQFPVAREPVALNDLVRGMGALFKSSLRPDVSVELDLPAVSPVATVDPQQIQLVVLNLVVNAAESMPRGGAVTITASDCAKPSARASWGTSRAGALLLVSDHGAGMEPQTVQRACDPFFTTKATVAAGLGLTVAYGIVQQGGGTLTIESAVGTGTTVAIALPGAELLHPSSFRAADD